MSSAKTTVENRRQTSTKFGTESNSRATFVKKKVPSELWKAPDLDTPVLKVDKAEHAKMQ
jgi:hypothetical protein